MEDYESKERKQTILGLAVQILERYRLFCGLLGVAETEAGAEDDRPPAKVAKKTISRAQQAGLLEEVYAKKIPQKVEGDIVAAQDGVILTRRREVS